MGLKPHCNGRKGNFVVTLTDILKDIDCGCMAHNMVEDKFSYRIVYFVNDGNRGKKFRVDTEYDGLRQSLENMIRKIFHYQIRLCLQRLQYGKMEKLSIC